MRTLLEYFLTFDIGLYFIVLKKLFSNDVNYASYEISNRKQLYINKFTRTIRYSVGNLIKRNFKTIKYQDKYGT